MHLINALYQYLTAGLHAIRHPLQERTFYMPGQLVFITTTAKLVDILASTNLMSRISFMQVTNFIS